MGILTVQQQIEKANEKFEKLGHIYKFKLQIEAGLKEVNEIIKKELKYSKDLRNVQYLNEWFSERHYFKQVLRRYK